MRRGVVIEELAKGIHVQEIAIDASALVGADTDPNEAGSTLPGICLGIVGRALRAMADGAVASGAAAGFPPEDL